MTKTILTVFFWDTVYERNWRRDSTIGNSRQLAVIRFYWIFQYIVAWLTDGKPFGLRLTVDEKKRSLRCYVFTFLTFFYFSNVFYLKKNIYWILKILSKTSKKHF